VSRSALYYVPKIILKEIYNTAYIHFGGMKFNVVLCPQCKTAKGVLKGSRTTRCTKCGKRINLKKARVLAEVDYESELAKVVGEINMKINNGEDIYQMDLDLVSKNYPQDAQVMEEPKDRYDRIAGKLSEVPGRDNKMVEAAKQLQKVMGDFTEDDFFEVLKRIGITEAEKQEGHLKRLIENDVLYQPRAGIYRFLEN
jgi:transcription elongation factor Elf1